MRGFFSWLDRLFSFSKLIADERGSLFPEGEGDDGGGTGDDGSGSGDGGEGEGDAAAKAAAAKAKLEADKKKKADDKVDRAEHERALADMHKYKKEAKEAKDRENKATEQKLKDEKKWEELATKKEQEAKDAKEESDKLRGSFVEGKKFDAIRLACEKLNLRPEAVGDLDALDLKDIQVETTSTGKINVLGAEKFAERLKTLKPHWFTDKRKPNVNTGGSKVLESDGPITPAMITEAEKAGRKSGDMKPYYDLHSQYQKQRTAARR